MSARDIYRDGKTLSLIVSTNKCIIHANSNFCEALGMREEDLVGKSVVNFRDACLPVEFYEDNWIGVTTEGVSERFALITSTDNLRLWIKGTSFPILDEDGNTIAYNGKFILISRTERQDLIDRINKKYGSAVVDTTRDPA